MNGLNDFLRGSSMVALLGLALFFLRYWKRTTDSLFAYFAAGFFILALGQVVVLIVGGDAEKAPYGYSVRLVAFLCIIVGIISKNLPNKQKPNS